MSRSPSILGRTFAAAMAFAALGLAALPAQASLIQMDQGGAYSLTYDYGSMGSGRGIGFQVGQNFNIHSIGIDLGVLAAAAEGITYKFSIFASVDGSSIGDLLAWTMVDDMQAGEGWIDRPIDFDFAAGSFYVINFSRADSHDMGAGVGGRFSYENQGGAPHDYGALTVVDGFQGAPPSGSETTLVPHMRFDGDVGAVPEPASWALMIMGVGGMGAILRRRRQGAVFA